MKALLAAVTEAREAATGRRLCDLFMVKPSKKDYPDYYKVILEPMDLRAIEHNIRFDKYMTEDSMIEDMKLMFRNARHYNEEGSQVGFCFSIFFLVKLLSISSPSFLYVSESALKEKKIPFLLLRMSSPMSLSVNSVTETQVFKFKITIQNIALTVSEIYP